MRITGGLARSIPLKTAANADVRPATDQMREAVFSSLGNAIAGKRFIDLFAGSGSYGLEALSRGAAGGVFVEKHRGSMTALSENLAAICKSIQCPTTVCEIIAQDVFSWVPSPDHLANIVFMDPPYVIIDQRKQDLADRALRCLDTTNNHGLLVFEHPAEIEMLLHGFELIKRLGGKKKNDPAVSILRTK